MGSIMGAEGNRNPGLDESEGTWHELPGDVYVVVTLEDCPLGVSTLRSAGAVPPTLKFDTIDGLLANHARHHSETGIPVGPCHTTGHETERV